MVCIRSNYICCVSCLSIFIPNFYDISFQPLLGYAAFLAIISLIISFLLWYFTRNWRRERKKTTRKEIRKYEDDDETIRRLRRYK